MTTISQEPGIFGSPRLCRGMGFCCNSAPGRNYTKSGLVLVMAQGIPEDLIDEIRQRTDIVGLIGEYLKLERRGKNMVGLCPFHSEKTPSFSVSSERQLYHCFGCGASGNAFNFMMEQEKLTFPEAARVLAERAGVKIPLSGSSAREETLKEKLHEINLLAAKYYAYCLNKLKVGQAALNYLEQRGISAESRQAFMIGYAPLGWTGFHDFAVKRRVDPAMLVKAGLVSAGRDNKHYDRFRDRLMFPIFNIRGRITGFGGRIIAERPGSGPKYLNSPETAIFNKGATLYGLNLTRETIRKEKTAILMEGYTDVIKSYQSGIKNITAPLGTALTETQVRLLHSQADTVVIAFDADSAGQAAAWRGLALLQDSGCLVRVADLPEGSDPDSYISKQGREAFSALVAGAVPLMDYRMARLKKDYDLHTDKGRKGYTDEVVDLLKNTANLVERDHYLKVASENLMVSEEILRAELKRRSAFFRKPVPESGVSGDRNEFEVLPAEKILISLMLHSKDIALRGRTLIKPDYLSGPQVRHLLEIITASAAEERTFSAEKILNRLDDERVRKFAAAAVADPALQDLEPSRAKRMLEDCCSSLQNMWLEKKTLELEQKIKELELQGLDDKVTELLYQYQQEIANSKADHNRSDKGVD